MTARAPALRIETLTGLAIAVGEEIGKARARGRLTERQLFQLFQLIELSAIEAYDVATRPPEVR